MHFGLFSRYSRVFLSFLLATFALIAPKLTWAQTANSGTVNGTVTDPSGAAVPNADVTIANPVAQYQREIHTDTMGMFNFPNLPFNSYHLTVTAPGFSALATDVDVHSSVPIALPIGLTLAAASDTSVTVSAGAEDLLNIAPTNTTTVDRNLIDKLPLESASSEVSSLVTLASPGVAADSNGLFHGLGDHAENSFSIDGQPITDQQSKVFSNQLPAEAVQSMDVISGAPPAEYGGKTSLVIDVTTRSGLGLKRLTGDILGSFGSFQTGNGIFDLGMGGDKWGNFAAVTYLNTNRFLDPPEFTVMHDGGDEQNIFDRVDYKFSKNNSLVLDFNYSRSWFQTPNSFDAQNATAWTGLQGGTICLVVCNDGLGPDGRLVPAANQRSLINTLNIAPTFTHIINSNTLFSLGFWSRGDQYTYFPSQDPFADLSPDLQGQSVGQYRTLTNIGERGTFAYVKGINNIKAGISFEQTLLHENDSFAIVDPTANAPCLNADGTPNTNPSINSPTQCGGPSNIGGTPNSAFIPLLGCYDLTRTAPLPGGNADGCVNPGQTMPGYYNGFNHNADIREFAVYVEDSITVVNTRWIPGTWNFNLGVRGDIYAGLTNSGQAEPRAGAAYNIKKTGTVLRLSYAHTLESPFNENLILSSVGCADPVVNQIMAVTQGIPCTTAPLSPGIRNEYHAGLEQAFGKFFVLSGEYIWKYTHNGYDFSVLGATPITFPVEWAKSKIPGFTIRGSMPNFHGLSAFVVMSSVAARFYPPTLSGITPLQPPGVFRIDHDELFNQTTHIQYQPRRDWPWIAFNWRYDSGLVAGAVPCFGGQDCPSGPGTTLPGVSPEIIDVSPLTPDQQFQAGLYCGSVHATPTTPISPNNLCPVSEYGSTLISIPAPGTENDDHNPQRIAPRHLFDLAIGDDDLFRHWQKNERYKWSAKLTIVNLANTVALYNFLSTFSGTHYVTPRSFTGQLGFHF